MMLQTPIRAGGALALTLGLGLFAFAGAAGAATAKGSANDRHALFVETDATTGNTVLSYQRATDGTITFAGRYSTGGDGATAAGASADPLASQGGLTLVNDNKVLIATNPGSDTVTVFSVDGTTLDLVQQISSQGLFPDSVAVDGRLVAVLNAGGAGSVAEYALAGDKLVALAGQVRSLGLSNTTPPEFLHGAGQVGYTPDGRHLVVTTKLSTNAYDVFSVGDHGTLGATPVVTSSVNAWSFSFTFDHAGNVVATEASNSSLTTYHVNADGSLTPLGSVSDGAAALCWVSTSNGYFFGSNAGSATVSTFDESNTGAPELVNATGASAHAGTTDSVVSPDSRFLYVESGGAGTVDAFSIGSGGSLTPIETIFDVPVGSEGIAAS